MLKAKWVDVVDIVSDIPRSNFSEEDIETLANKILQADGLLVPLLLEKRDIATYTVISGHLEYYAAVRAKEIDLRSAEMVNAFILPDENKEQPLAQLELIKGIYNNEDSKSNREENIILKIMELQESNKKLISLVEKLENNFTRDIQELKTKIFSLESKLGETKPDDKILPEMLQVIVDDFNDLEIPKLEHKLRLLELPKVGEPILQKIIKSVQEERQKSEFKKLNDLKRVKELGEKRIDRIKNSWNQVSPVTS